MRLNDSYSSSVDPFEGDRTINLRSLPAGARVTRASIKLIPVKRAETAVLFEETLALDDNAQDGELPASDWGVTRSLPAGVASFVEVDFHARRMLAGVEGSGGDVTLQINMGGAYVSIAKDGTLWAPGKDEWEKSLSDNPSVPGLTVNKFKLSQAEGNTSDLALTRVKVRSVPSNLSVRLGQMPPFWVRLGELASPNGEASPDFAAVLTAFLAQAPVENGYYQVPFVVHSDTIARLEVEVTIDYVLERMALPPHLPEVSLPYNYSTLPGAGDRLLALALPRQAIPIPGGASAQVRGEFQPTRVAFPTRTGSPAWIAFGEVGQAPGVFKAVVSPQRALAQALRSEQEIAVTGLDLPLASTAPGLPGLHTSIMEDADGKPSGVALISAPVRVEKPLPGQSAWGAVSLPSPFRVMPGERYWVVLQSEGGEAYWSAGAGTAGEPPLHASSDGGFSWQAARVLEAPGPVSAHFRLRHTPERFSVPVQFQIGEGPSAVRRALDEFAPLGRVEFSFDFADKLAEHLHKPEIAPPCGAGELLVNGSFDNPPHNDATRRLFGFDIGEGSTQTGRVDLSRGGNLATERFINLFIGDDTFPRIDCAGTEPTQTTIEEIISAINEATGRVDLANDMNGKLHLEYYASGSEYIALQPVCHIGSPSAWYVPTGVKGDISRIKVASARSIDLENVITILPPECIAAVLDATRNWPARLAQQVQVAGGCAYRLCFSYRRGIDFTNRCPFSYGPNPLEEWGIQFTLLKGDSVSHNSFKDLGLGVTGLDCGLRLKVIFPFITPDVNLIMSIAAGSKVVVEAFRKKSSVATITLNGGDAGPRVATLAGPAIDSLVISTSGHEILTLLHAVEFGGSAWGVRWLDATGSEIGAADGKLGLDKLRILPNRDMCRAEMQLMAPPSASAAEIYFSRAYPGILFLADVSFTPSDETLTNGSFRAWQSVSGGWQLPAGWTRVDGLLDALYNEQGTLIGIELRGDAPEGVILAQTVDIVAGKTYELNVLAWPKVPLKHDLHTLHPNERARLELRWLGDAQIGVLVFLPLDGCDFPKHSWSGTAPEGATKAEIRLVQPQGLGSLVVEEVSLRVCDLVDIPLTFLAEAPGQLTVSDLRVVYDLP